MQRLLAVISVATAVTVITAAVIVATSLAAVGVGAVAAVISVLLPQKQLFQFILPCWQLFCRLLP